LFSSTASVSEKNKLYDLTHRFQLAKYRQIIIWCGALLEQTKKGLEKIMKFENTNVPCCVALLLLFSTKTIKSQDLLHDLESIFNILNIFGPKTTTTGPTTENVQTTPKSPAESLCENCTNTDDYQASAESVEKLSDFVDSYSEEVENFQEFRALNKKVR